MKKKRRKELLKRCDLGYSAAEHDEDLMNYYVQNNYFDSAIDFESPVSFFIGRKGTGKSAILKMLKLQFGDENIIELSADDFALQTIAASGLFTNSLNGHRADELLYQTIWTYMILIRVLRRVFKGDSWWEDFGRKFTKIFGVGKKKDSVIRFFRDASKLESGSLTFGESVLKLLETLNPKFSITMPEGPTASVELKPGYEKNPRAALAQLDLFKQISEVVKHIGEILDQKKYWIIVDDLDLNWHNEYAQNSFIRGLFKAMKKLLHVRELKLAVSLREDIFINLKLEDSDKFRDYIDYVEFDPIILQEIIKTRLSYKYGIAKANLLDSLFKGQVKGKNPFTYISSRCNTARDAVQLTQLCIDHAVNEGSEKIEEKHILFAENEFSRLRLSDLASEFEYTFPSLDQLLFRFKSKRKEMPYGHVCDTLMEAIYELADNDKMKWIVPYFENLDDLILILVRIGFLGLKLSRTDKATFFQPHDVMPDIKPGNWFSINNVFEKALLLE